MPTMQTWLGITFVPSFVGRTVRAVETPELDDSGELIIWPAPICGVELLVDIREFNVCVEPPLRSEPPLLALAAEETSNDCAKLCFRNIAMSAEFPAFVP